MAQSKVRAILNLAVLAIARTLGGIFLSLLPPFYTKEALAKGLDVTHTGMLIGMPYLVIMLSSPWFGKRLGKFGSKKLFIFGTFVEGVGIITFGLLQWINSPINFFACSFLAIAFTTVGMTSFTTTIIPVIAESVDPSHKNTAFSVLETTYGIGKMSGPLLGSALVSYGGFFLPFLVFGSILLVCSASAIFLLKLEPMKKDKKLIMTKPYNSLSFRKIFGIPPAIHCLVLLGISGMSTTFYLPSLQPFTKQVFALTNFEMGLLFMVPEAIYTIFSPVCGLLLDHWVTPVKALTFGYLTVVVGYLLMGPSPMLSSILPLNVYLMAVAIGLVGLSSAAVNLTAMSFIMSSSLEVLFSFDADQVRGLVSSLWFMTNYGGCFFGSLTGSLAFDLLGFQWLTTAFALLLLLVTFSIPGFLFYGENKNADCETQVNIAKEEKC